MSKTDPPPPPRKVESASSRGERVAETEDRDAILARRAFFIAGAVAGLTLTACEPRADPAPCLSVAVLDGGSGNEITDAGELVAIDGGAGSEGADGGAPKPAGDTSTPDAGGGVNDGGIPPLKPVDGGIAPDGGPMPQPCLRMVPPKAPPKPCLSVKPPENK